MTQDEERYQWLLEQVFRTDAGQQLLDEWYTMHCVGLFDENALQMARRIGRADFINDIKTMLDQRSE